MEENIDKHLYKTHIITKILSSHHEESFKLFLENIDILQDVNFIIPNPYLDGLDYKDKFKELAPHGVDVIFLFSKADLYCFNANSFMSTMLYNKDNVKIESVVSLDTQILSYLYRNFKNQDNSIPANIAEVIKLIKSKKCRIDSFPYIFENMLFSRDFAYSSLCNENLFAFETYFFDNKKQAANYAKKVIDYDKKMFGSDFAMYWRRLYKMYYLELLVMADIQINKKHLSVFEKENYFVKFFHENFACISDREVNLAKIYFLYGSQVGFFNKIQKGNEYILNNLKNMAWDIFHIHNTTNNLVLQTTDEVDFTMPFFITYDRRLKDIIPIYQFSSAAFIKGSTEKWLNYKTNLIDPVIEKEYFTLTAYQDRLNRLKENGTNEESFINEIDKYISVYEQRLH